MAKKKHSVAVVARECALAKHLAASLEVDFVSVELKQFADAESIIKLSDERHASGRLVFLVYQFSFSRSINDQLLEFLLLAHHVKTCGAEQIVAVVPYLPYARQCKDVDNKHVGPLQAVGRLFKSVEIDYVIACDLHEVLCESLFPVSLRQISLENVWAHLLKNEFPDEEIVLLSPDHGGLKRVEHVAKILGKESIAHVEKKRVGYDESVALKFVGDVQDRTVVILDDIVDTGSTAIHAAQMAQERGAKKVVACFSHAVLSKDAVVLLEKSCIEKIWVTNSILDIKPGKKMTILPIEETVAAFVKGCL